MVDIVKKVVIIEPFAESFTEMFEEEGYYIECCTLSHISDFWFNLKRGDIILFTGGNDIWPDNYGEPPHELAGPFDHKRDEREFRFLRDLIKNPLHPAWSGILKLGVCRGFQLLNTSHVIGAGKLNQHIVGHTMRTGKIFNVETGKEFVVCEDHHQAVLRSNLRLEVIARDARDGNIEAGYYPHTHSLGVQWHPEWDREGCEGRKEFFNLINKYHWDKMEQS